jgi:hypothetical protein
MATTKKLAIAEIPPEPVMAPYGDADRATEAKMVAWLKDQPTEEIRIPGGLTVSGVLEVIYNGTRFSLAEMQTVTVPTPIAAIIRQRIEGVPERDRKFLR